MRRPVKPSARSVESKRLQHHTTSLCQLLTLLSLRSVPAQKTRIQVWLYENTDLRIEGKIIGFDEYMNLVLDDAEELQIKKKTRKQLGRILLKGDSITLMMAAPTA